MSQDQRKPMSPAQFDAACRVVEAENPSCWQSSGYRNPVYNMCVPGAQTNSKHAMLPVMARDYCALSEAELQAIASSARRQELWVIVHDSGTGRHVHLQGLPTGPTALDWWRKHGETRDGNGSNY